MLDLGAPFMFIHKFNFNDLILSRSQMKSPLIVVVVPIIPQKVKKQVAVNVEDHVNHACPESILLLIFVNKNTEFLVAVFLKALTSSIPLPSAHLIDVASILSNLIIKDEKILSIFDGNLNHLIAIPVLHDST